MPWEENNQDGRALSRREPRSNWRRLSWLRGQRRTCASRGRNSRTATYRAAACTRATYVVAPSWLLCYTRIIVKDSCARFCLLDLYLRLLLCYLTPPYSLSASSYLSQQWRQDRKAAYPRVCLECFAVDTRGAVEWKRCARCLYWTYCSRYGLW